jgi:hypothetical protein
VTQLCYSGNTNRKTKLDPTKPRPLQLEPRIIVDYIYNNQLYRQVSLYTECNHCVPLQTTAITPRELYCTCFKEEECCISQYKEKVIRYLEKRNPTEETIDTLRKRFREPTNSYSFLLDQLDNTEFIEPEKSD